MAEDPTEAADPTTPDATPALEPEPKPNRLRFRGNRLMSVTKRKAIGSDGGTKAQALGKHRRFELGEAFTREAGSVGGQRAYMRLRGRYHPVEHRKFLGLRRAPVVDPDPDPDPKAEGEE